MLAANRRLAEELRLHVTVRSDSRSSTVVVPAADNSRACALIMELLLEASSD